jgi:hypothetical protein
MTFKQFLLASCALVISVTTATAQIPSYVPTDGLVGWWPFNGNANEESGNGNDGMVNGATLGVDRYGLNGKAYHFDGIGNSIVLGNIDPFLGTPSNVLTIRIRFKTDNPILSNNLYQTASILSDYNRSITCCELNYLVELNIYRNPMRLAWLQRGSNVDYNSESIGYDNDNVWHSLILIMDGIGTKSIYFDGNLEAVSAYDASANYAEQTSPWQTYWQVGATHWSDGSIPSGNIHYYNGLVDDIAIYNRALTPEEIQNLYTGSDETVDTGNTGNGAAPLPQGIPYQAAARDAQGQALVNAAINVRFTLHEGAADGAASYAETHALTTNSVGLFNTVFGNGTPEQSAFDSINWAATTKFLQVEIDLGEGYVDMGTTQLLSVPYALRSDEAARVKNAGLPIFSNNAAALAGGLVAGEMYRTAAGVLMIVY